MYGALTHDVLLFIPEAPFGPLALIVLSRSLFWTCFFFNWPTWTFDSVGKSKKIDFWSIIGWCACIEPLLLVVSLLLTFTFLRQVYSKLPWRRLSGYSNEVDDDASYPCFPFMEDFLESHEPPSQKNDVYSIFKVFNVLICLPEFGYTSSFCTIYIVGGENICTLMSLFYYFLCAFS